MKVKVGLTALLQSKGETNGLPTSPSINETKTMQSPSSLCFYSQYNTTIHTDGKINDTSPEETVGNRTNAFSGL